MLLHHFSERWNFFAYSAHISQSSTLISLTLRRFSLVSSFLLQFLAKHSDRDFLPSNSGIAPTMIGTLKKRESSWVELWYGVNRLRRGGKEIAKNIRTIIASDSETSEIIVSPWFHFEREVTWAARPSCASWKICGNFRRRRQSSLMC